MTPLSENGSHPSGGAGGGVGGGGVLQIPSDGNDRVGAKIKTRNNP